MKMEGRVRRSRGSVDRHTSQSHPIIGTPCEVPLPSSVILRFNDPFAAARRLDEAQAELVENLFQNLALFSGQIAPRFLIEQREDLDHLRGALEVRFELLPGRRIGQVAEMDRRGAGERQHESRERERGLAGWRATK